MKRYLITLLLIPILTFAQNEHIILDSIQANLIKGRSGIYSEIQPIKNFDGKFIIPKRVLDDPDLAGKRSQLLSVASVIAGIKDLPAVGQTVYKDSLYLSENGVIKCRQTHARTIYPPSQTPALFSFFRENSDTLQWIPNEEVLVGWKRIYNGVTYLCLQSHMTLETWTPPNTPALWQAQGGGGQTCPAWIQPTGAHDAYNIGDCVIYLGKCYESLINANVWSPTVYPQGWREITCP